MKIGTFFDSLKQTNDYTQLLQTWPLLQANFLFCKSLNRLLNYNAKKSNFSIEQISRNRISKCPSPWILARFARAILLFGLSNKPVWKLLKMSTKSRVSQARHMYKIGKSLVMLWKSSTKLWPLLCKRNRKSHSRAFRPWLCNGFVKEVVVVI